MIEDQGHAVRVVAEGVGQLLMARGDKRRDKSGNILHDDIGILLATELSGYLAGRDFPVALNYLDTSYHICSVPANVYDRYLYDQMGHYAVQAAMAGKTGLIVGSEHGHYVHVPIPVVSSRTERMDVSGDLWRAILESTS